MILYRQQWLFQFFLMTLNIVAPSKIEKDDGSGPFFNPHLLPKGAVCIGRSCQGAVLPAVSPP